MDFDYRGAMKAALDDPADDVAAHAAADGLLDEGALSLATAWRWMARTGRRPGFRTDVRSKNKWVWYRSGGLLSAREEGRRRQLPHAVLDAALWQLCYGPRDLGQYRAYEHHESAVVDLAVGLAVARRIVEGA